MTREDGFTLIEILVALAIVGLALGGIFSSIGIGTRASAESETERRATQEAQSFLDRIGREIPIVDGTTRGEWTGGLRWTLELKPLPDQPEARGVLSGHLSTLSVDWLQGGKPRHLEFHGMLIGPAS